MSPASHPLARFSVGRPVTLSMVVFGVLVMGWISLSRLPLEFLPTFSSSSISVQVSYPSAAPEEVERRILRPLEDSLGTINGIETLSATASPDSGSVSITFVDGVDMDLAAVDVRDRVDRVRHLLPSDLDQVRIRRFQSTDIPILSVGVAGDQKREELFAFVEDVMVRRLERLDGVAQVTVRGLQTPNVHVDLRPDRLQAHRVSVRDLVTNVRNENRNLTLGDVRDGSRKLLVRSMGEFESLDDLRRMPLDSAGLRLQDVAEVNHSFPRKDSYQFLNGSEQVVVRINKVSTGNLLEVADRARAEIESIVALPRAEGLDVRIFHDASEDVRLGLMQLRNAGLFGGGLAIVSVFFFLRRLRTTLLVAVAIPISVIATFVMMYLLRQGGMSDITLNVVSLAGLMLALGMLVDNSIVVIESIFRHRNELREEARDAAIRGTSEVALPILASTATTLCVFVPVIFFGGEGWTQTYLKNIATTVSIVMTASLLVALTVVPMTALFFLRGQSPRPPGLVRRLTGGYGKMLEFVLRFRLPFFGVVVLLLYGSIHLFGTIERSFSNRTEEREVSIQVEMPRSFSIEQKEELFEELYELIDGRREQLDVADISYGFDRSAGASRGFRRSNNVQLYLVEESEGSKTTSEVREEVRKLLPVHAGVSLKLSQASRRGGGGGIEVQLSGQDLSVLELLAGRLAEELRAIPSLKDVDTSLESGDEEIRVLVDDDRALQAGLSSQQIAATVSGALSSRAVSRFKTADREIDLVVQNREEDRETLSQLRQTPVRTTGASVPLETLAKFRSTPGPRQIEREDHLAKVKVTANTSNPRETFTAMGQVGAAMAAFPLPPGYSWSFGRWNRYQQEEQEVGTAALWFAVLLIYMLMAALFESFAQPFTILFSVPFALLGVAVVMKLANQPMDTMTNIGVIILLGVVVNNAIVLTDHINHLRRAGMERNAAIVLGGKHRLRPILMTAATTIVGLLPLVAPILLPAWFGPVEGRAGTWAPIGLVILGGLTTSTFLTLVILPIVYTLVDDISNFLRRVTRLA